MTTPYCYSTTYILDKAHFDECYTQSVKPDPTLKPYYKAIGFGLIGIALIFADVSLYLAYFFVGLGVIEALNVKYNKAWWLMRQMMSKAANNEVTLIVDEQGIHTKSRYVNAQILWTDIYRIVQTDKGFLITHKTGTSYISNRSLDNACIAFIQTKI
ncbi:YcxB family protein [Shewanella sp. DNRA4]|uniref:YcxB family protein n=1 Tax=Shewanella sp. DNRA4 TaxID=2723055 RepID=UPI00146D2B06|nr:YcxB family protein [Shewanella sp. DNRA4]NMD53901.1 YcxB family protein [Shewanella sp. DNRA4]